MPAKKSIITLPKEERAVLEVPRDREWEFEPQIVAKHRREWRGFNDKILSLCGLGL